MAQKRKGFGAILDDRGTAVLVARCQFTNKITILRCTMSNPGDKVKPPPGSEGSSIQILHELTYKLASERVHLSSPVSLLIISYNRDDFVVDALQLERVEFRTTGRSGPIRVRVCQLDDTDSRAELPHCYPQARCSTPFSESSSFTNLANTHCHLSTSDEWFLLCWATRETAVVVLHWLLYQHERSASVSKQFCQVLQLALKCSSSSSQAIKRKKVQLVNWSMHKVR